MTYMVHLPGAKTDLMRQHNVPAEDIVVLDEQPAGAFERVLLAVFLGCATGYDNQSWGSPAKGVLLKGAECTIGFHGTIHSDGTHGPKGAQYWAREFWRLVCEEGFSVQVAADIASDGTDMGNNLKIKYVLGNKFIRLKPPRYGNGN